MKTNFQKPNQVCEVGHMSPQRYKLVRCPFGHDEARAVDTDKKGKRSVDDARRPLIRARAGELEERSPQVRKLSHNSSHEPIPTRENV